MHKVNPIKRHGGKHYLAKKIIQRFPAHLHYVEPYFGGGSVLFAKPPEWIEGYSEVVNDIDVELSHFWYVLRSPSKRQEFINFLELTPVSQLEWEVSGSVLNDFQNYNYSAIAKAAAFFIYYRQSRQGLGKDFNTLSKNRTRRGMNEQVSAWLSAIEGLPEAAERLRRVVILNDDALDVIRQQDGPNTFFYCDPPYMHESRTTTSDFLHEMTDDEHAELLDTLAGIQGKFMLSGYHSDLYDEHAKMHGWRYHEIPIDNKASSQKEKPVKIEVLWMNYEPLEQVATQTAPAS